MDSTSGRYEATGNVKNITTEQINPLALSLANVEVNSFNIHSLDFNVSGDDFEARSNVKMRYNDLAITIRKTDKETGATKTNKFITRIVNKFVMWPDNPGGDGVERTAISARVSRLTTQSFLGIFWKAIFAGMQDIMMRSGRYE